MYARVCVCVLYAAASDGTFTDAQRSQIRNRLPTADPVGGQSLGYRKQSS